MTEALQYQAFKTDLMTLLIEGLLIEKRKGHPHFKRNIFRRNTFDLL